MTGITQPDPDLRGAKWGAIIAPHGAISGIAERSRHAPELASSHGEPHWTIPKPSFVWRGQGSNPFRSTTIPWDALLEHARHGISWSIWRPSRLKISIILSVI